MKGTSVNSYANLTLALGGNLGDVLGTFSKAFQLIASQIGEIKNYSKVYRTKPLNPPQLKDSSQPDFINSACLCQTKLSPQNVLQEITKIEKSLGRTRTSEARWGPRTIDIDLLTFDDLIYSSPTLTIPHPELHNRDFVLQPLHDILPDFKHPLLNLTVKQMIDSYKDRGLPKFICGTVDGSNAS